MLVPGAFSLSPFLRELIPPRVSSRRLCAEKHKVALFTQNTLPPNEEDFVSRLVCTYAIFFELVFSMTASSECRVSRVFSAFMRKATHISAGEDRVLQTARKRRKQRKGRVVLADFLGPKSPPKRGSIRNVRKPSLAFANSLITTGFCSICQMQKRSASRGGAGKRGGGGYGYFVTQALKPHLPSVRGHPFLKNFSPN